MTISVSKQIISFQFLLLILVLFKKNHQALSSHDNSTSSIKSVCESTPYPDVCFLSSQKVSFSSTSKIYDNFNILLQSLKDAISEAKRVINLLSDITNDNFHEEQKGTIQDCNELYEITIASLHDSLVQLTSTSGSDELTDVSTYLAAAATNTDTCLEELKSAYGPLKPPLVDSITNAYKPIINSLLLLSKENVYTTTPSAKKGMSWLSKQKFRHHHHINSITVAKDGSGNFTTITDAINFAPNNSIFKVIINIKRGLYEEYIVIPKNKPNIVFHGEGSYITIISGNRNWIDGWHTYRSATVGVSGRGFMARDIGFHNVAGPEKKQAVALRINSDFAALYRCTIRGYQDTLYVHSFTQFYRECDIYGTTDFIFGDATVVFQKCDITTIRHLPDQTTTVITAQSRTYPYENTGMSFTNCNILATKGFRNSGQIVKSYLGRPWRDYARVVFIESYIDDFIDPEGWIPWSGRGGLDTLYYGEYRNVGPGSDIQGRVKWLGHHVMDYNEASNFKVSKFINGQKWLYYTTFPYDY